MPSHARRVRQLRVPALQGCQRAHRKRATNSATVSPTPSGRRLTDNSLAFRAAELEELAQTPEAFWSAHNKLMTRSMQLTGDDLVAVAADLGVNADFALNGVVRHARARVEADIASSRASGVRFTPTFYINRRRYDRLWERALSSTRSLVRSGPASVRRPLTSRAGAPSRGHFAGPRDRGHDRHHELSASGRCSRRSGPKSSI